MAQEKLSRRAFVGVSALAAASMAAGLAGCGTQQTEQAEDDGSLPEGGAGMGMDTAIVVASFGTSYASARHACIGAIESDIREAYPDVAVYRAFTSQIIIDHVQADTGRHIDTIDEALDKALARGARRVVVQPTHLMDGFEYQDVAAAVQARAAEFDAVALGEPLLSSEADFQAVADAVVEALSPFDDGQTALCLMGHGTEAESNEVYARMQQLLRDRGLANYFVATVEAEPTFSDVAAAAHAAGLSRAVLRPLMVVAGDHAHNDMADASDPESFAGIMQAAGFQVESVVEGLGQLVAIDELYVAHAAAAFAQL